MRQALHESIEYRHVFLVLACSRRGLTSQIRIKVDWIGTLLDARVFEKLRFGNNEYVCPIFQARMSFIQLNTLIADGVTTFCVGCSTHNSNNQAIIALR